MKTIIITGASSGLGKATAKVFAAQGWRVIATMRQPEKETELTVMKNVHVLPLDVTSTKSIQQVVADAISIGPVNVVFNNAGYGLAGPLEAYTDAQILRQLETNVLGVIRTTRAFVPHLRENKGGLIVSTTSIGGLVAFPFASVYHATKWAIEGWSESLSFELAMHNIKVKTVSPGGIATDFMSRSLDNSSHEAYAALYDRWIASFSNADSPLVFSSAEDIAAVVYEAVTDDKDQLRYLAGPDAIATYSQRLKAGPEAFRKGIAASLGR